MFKKSIFISNLAWNNKDLKSIIKLINKYKFDGIDIAPLKILNNWNHIEQKFQKLSLVFKNKKIKINALQGIFYKTNLNIFEDYNNNFQNIFDHITKIIKLCKILRCKKIIIGSTDFRNPKNLPKKKAKMIFLNFLKKSSKLLKKHKIYFCVETIPMQYNEKFIYNINTLSKIIKGTNSKWIKINFDTSLFHHKNMNKLLFLKNARLIQNIQITEKNFNYFDKVSKNNILFYKLIKNKKNFKEISLEIISKKTNLIKLEKTFQTVSNLFNRN